MAHEANALSTYTVKNTVALKLFMGKTSDLAINVFCFFHTKSSMEETQLDRIASDFSLSTSFSLLESKKLLISLVELWEGRAERMEMAMMTSGSGKLRSELGNALMEREREREEATSYKNITQTLDQPAIIIP
jgi:hypothetical protein